MTTEYDITPERAIELIAAATAPSPTETVPVAAAAGRVLRAELVSLVDRPAADDSALDGFACLVADTSGATAAAPVELELIGESPAGAPFAGRLAPGQAVKVATGGLVPTAVRGEPLGAPGSGGPRGGARPVGEVGVVGVEHAEARGAKVVVRAPASAGAVRPRGQDLLAGSPYLRSGTLLDSASVGLASAMGHGELPVARRPRVALVTTGDEVVPPGQRGGRGLVYDANGAALSAAAARAGCEVVAVDYARDDEAALRAVLDRHVDGAAPPDLIVTSGGVSRGERDVVRDVLGAAGELAFWRVGVRPAGPTMFGRYRGVAVLGLPGNPVSSLVGFLLFGRAFSDTALGCAAPLPYYRRLPVRLAGAFTPQAKTVLHRAHLAYEGGVVEARPFPNQSSGVLRSLVEADALVVTPPAPAGGGGAGGAAAGPRLGEAIYLRHLL